MFRVLFTITLYLLITISHATENSGEVRFLILSDIHFDPFYACHRKPVCPLITELQKSSLSSWPTLLNQADGNFPIIYRDSNFNLLNHVLSLSSKVANEDQINTVFILGDLLGHNFVEQYKKYFPHASGNQRREFIKKLIQFITLQMKQAFPGKNIIYTFGNNDSYNADYYLKPNDEIYKDTHVLWVNPLLAKNNVHVNNRFKHGGYYALDMPDNPNLRMIVLNTVYYSNKARARIMSQAGVEELAWLKNELQNVKKRNQKACILMHIPPSVDFYLTTHWKIMTLRSLWKERYIESFYNILSQFHNEIDGIFASHLHTNWFHILKFDNKEIPFVGTAAISPIFGNAPSFKEYFFNKNKGSTYKNYVVSMH